MKLLGTVKWFNDDKGYGFIVRDDERSDVYVHYTGIQREGPGRSTLTKGDRVQFEVVNSPDGLRAVDVVVIDADATMQDGNGDGDRRGRGRTRQFRRVHAATRRTAPRSCSW